MAGREVLTEDNEALQKSMLALRIKIWSLYIVEHSIVVI